MSFVLSRNADGDKCDTDLQNIIRFFFGKKKKKKQKRQ